MLFLSGEAPFEAERSLAPIQGEQAFLGRLLEALLAESNERVLLRNIERRSRGSRAAASSNRARTILGEKTATRKPAESGRPPGAPSGP